MTQINNDDVYPLFKSCYELIESLSEEKNLKLGKLAILSKTIELYGTILAQMHAHSKSKESMDIMDLVDWSKLR